MKDFTSRNILRLFRFTLFPFFPTHFFSQLPEVLISLWPDQEGKKLQRPNSNFCKLLKKKNQKFFFPSNQFSAAAMTSASDEKWRTFICFFQSGRAKNLSAPLCRCPAALSGRCTWSFALCIRFFPTSVLFTPKEKQSSFVCSLAYDCEV